VLAPLFKGASSKRGKKVNIAQAVGIRVQVSQTNNLALLALDQKDENRGCTGTVFRIHVSGS
jgi:hypothetical protein